MRDVPLAHLMALSAAAYRAFAETAEPWSNAESTLPKDDPVREQMGAFQAELCRIWNDSLRAVIRAPVYSIEEARAKAAFLLRPEFEAWDLLEEKPCALGMLRSLAFADEQKPDPVLPFIQRWGGALDAYRDEPDETMTREREKVLCAELSKAEDAFTAAEPVATTAAGAAAALRHFVKDSDAGDRERLGPSDRMLIAAALGYLDSASQSPAA